VGLLSAAAVQWGLGSDLVPAAKCTVERIIRLGYKGREFAHEKSVAGNRCPLAE